MAQSTAICTLCATYNLTGSTDRFGCIMSDFFGCASMNQSVTVDPTQGQDIEFHCFGLTLTAKRWGNPNGDPVLALHGWLDNANTFDRLAPLLPELDLVALDFAGHGLSDYRPEGVHYQPLLDMQDLLAIAEQLGWQQFALIGHSMGGAIASEFAATFPDRITKVVSIDGFLATGGATKKERIEQNRDAIRQMLNAKKKQPRPYTDTAEMITRVSAATDQSPAAAERLVARGHRTLADGRVTWRTDPRIRFSTPMRPDSDYINTLIAQTTAPGLLISAEQGDRWYQGEVDERQAHHPNLKLVRLDGPHHLHLEPDHVETVGEVIRDFLEL